MSRSLAEREAFWRPLPAPGGPPPWWSSSCPVGTPPHSASSWGREAAGGAACGHFPSPKAPTSSVSRFLTGAPAHAEFPQPLRFSEVPTTLSLPSFVLQQRVGLANTGQVLVPPKKQPHHALSHSSPPPFLALLRDQGSFPPRCLVIPRNISPQLPSEHPTGADFTCYCPCLTHKPGEFCLGHVSKSLSKCTSLGHSPGSMQTKPSP